MNNDLIDKILKEDIRYQREAYNFVFEALQYTLKKIGKYRHISGGELLDGIRNYALQQFGPLAKMVFNKWGVLRTDDFGEIVFNLVNAGLMGKTEDDSKDDFKDRYDFNEVFKDGAENIINERNEK
ncbi:MAG: Minf_1886 family protein [Planctomycetota bacterium]